MTDEERCNLERMLSRCRQVSDLAAGGSPDARFLEHARPLFEQLQQVAERVDGGPEWLRERLRDEEQGFIRPGILEQIQRRE